MPSISDLRIKPGSGAVVPTTSGLSTGSNVRSSAASTPLSFTVQSPSTGVALYDSSTVNGNNIVLALRNLIAGSGIALSDDGGVIRIATENPGGIGPTGPTGAIGATGPTGSGGGSDYSSSSYVRLGLDASTEGYSAVGIGFYSNAYGGTAPTAVGSNAIASGNCATAIGYNTEATGFRSLTVGNFAASHGNYGITIGYDCQSQGTGAIAIGPYTNANGGQSVAIGYDATAIDSDSIAIGKNATTNYASTGSIAIGKNALVGTYSGESTAIGYGVQVANNCYGSIVLGVYSQCEGSLAIAIGVTSLATHSAVAVGLGCYSGATAANAFGFHASAHAHGSTAIGAYSTAHQPFSMVLGNGADKVPGSFVIGGYSTSSPLLPCDHFQRFIGHTTSDLKASAGWGDGSYLANVTFDTPGVIGNSYVLHTVRSGINTSLHAQFDGTNFIINFATDGSGNATNANTLSAIGALFPTNGFSFSYTSGFDAQVVTFEFLEDFDGGRDGSTNSVLTADGNSPVVDLNTPTIWSGSVATVTGRVVGVGVNAFNDGDDAASFVLPPTLLVRKNDDTYTIIGDGVFTLENGSDGTDAWSVPTLATGVGGTVLILSVDNNINPEVNWMGHLQFQTST